MSETLMTAIVRDRGFQHTVREGDTFKVNRLSGKIGSEISLDEVLFLERGPDIRVGTPLVEGARVECEILGHPRGEKITIFKMKRRKNYRRKTGHRQNLTLLKVKEIKAGS